MVGSCPGTVFLLIPEAVCRDLDVESDKTRTLGEGHSDLRTNFETTAQLACTKDPTPYLSGQTIRPLHPRSLKMLGRTISSRPA